jgi:hypothetical protein
LPGLAETRLVLASHRETTLKQEPPIEFDQAAFLKERREMLLSLDVATCRAYARKWGGTIPTLDGTVLWSMHMARTAAQAIPAIERKKSQYWLEHHDHEGKLR